MKKSPTRIIDMLDRSSVQYDADIKEIKETMMTKVAGDIILEELQDLIRRFDEAERFRTHIYQLMDLRLKIDDHEKRLVALENHPQI